MRGFWSCPSCGMNYGELLEGELEEAPAARCPDCACQLQIEFEASVVLPEDPDSRPYLWEFDP